MAAHSLIEFVSGQHKRVNVSAHTVFKAWLLSTWERAINTVLHALVPANNSDFFHFTKDLLLCHKALYFGIVQCWIHSLEIRFVNLDKMNIQVFSRLPEKTLTKSTKKTGYCKFINNTYFLLKKVSYDNAFQKKRREYTTQYISFFIIIILL